MGKFLPAPQHLANNTVKLLERINLSRDKLEEVTVSEAHARVERGWGQSYWLEAYTSETPCKPFLDFDQKLDQAPTVEELTERLGSIQTDARKILNLPQDAEMRVAHGHRALPGENKFKVSFRVFVPGYKTTVKDLRQYVPDKGDEQKRGWDPKVYSAGGDGRLLRLLGCIKKPFAADRSVLQPQGQHPFSDYLISVLDGTEKDLPPPPKRPQRRIQRRGSSGQENQDPNAEDVSYLSHLTAADMIGKAMEFFFGEEMSGAAATAVVGNRVDFTNIGGVRKCMHGHDHTSNHCCMFFNRDGNVVYRCRSTECSNKEVVVGVWRESRVQELTLEEKREFDPVLLADQAERLLGPDYKDIVGGTGPKKRKGTDKMAAEEFMNVWGRQYLDHFFKWVGSEVLEVSYKEDGETIESYIRMSHDELFKRHPYVAEFITYNKNDIKRASNRYSRFAFHPNIDHIFPKGRTFNLCIGSLPHADIDLSTPLSTSERECVEPIISHIRNGLCGNVEEGHFHWLMQWMAAPLQQRGYRTELAPIFTGPQGCGKSIIFENLFANVYGVQHLLINREEDLHAKFNSVQQGVTFVCVDEATWVGNHKLQNTLKSMITCKQENIEAKGKDVIRLDCYKNYVFLSNDKKPVFISTDDRRFMCFECKVGS